MARMYSRARGKSGSKRPLTKVKPTWIRLKPKEIELLVVKLAKEGNSPSKIGTILRDTYGVPSVKLLTNKKITAILEEKKISKKLPEDLLALIKRVSNLKKHLEENKKDMTALRGLQITESKIKKLVKYYKQQKKIPVDWKYDRRKVSLFIE